MTYHIYYFIIVIKQNISILKNPLDLISYLQAESNIAFALHINHPEKSAGIFNTSSPVDVWSLQPCKQGMVVANRSGYKTYWRIISQAIAVKPSEYLLRSI